jgi:predicted PurR-regulated permease PerM
MNNHHISVWSVVVLVVGIVTMSFGIVFGFIRETTARTLEEIKATSQLQEKRISLLERASDVSAIQLIIMDKKLDEIGKDVKTHMGK